MENMYITRDKSMQMYITLLKPCRKNTRISKSVSKNKKEREMKSKYIRALCKCALTEGPHLDDACDDNSELSHALDEG